MEYMLNTAEHPPHSSGSPAASWASDLSTFMGKLTTLASESEDVKMDDDDQLWRCEFCGHNNVVNLE